MTSADIIQAIRTWGLETSLSYKLKTKEGARDVAVFRWDEELKTWRDFSLPVKQPLRGWAVLNKLELGLLRGLSVVPFDCCCQKCLTPEKRKWTAGYTRSTNLRISHGYHDECYAAALQSAKLESAAPGLASVTNGEAVQ